VLAVPTALGWLLERVSGYRRAEETPEGIPPYLEKQQG